VTPPERKSTAAAAADRVRAVLEAAEQSAAELRAEAAEEIEGQLARAQAVAERLSGRADEIESALQRLADSVRDEISALKADLEELRAVKEGIGDVPADAKPDPEPVIEDSTPTVPEGEGVEGARVIALNMALTGSPREETARYLSENFQIDDPEALLDDVYARASS
jgi:small-conductance mechanosensitive channel